MSSQERGNGSEGGARPMLVRVRDLRLHVEELLAEHLICPDYRDGACPGADPASRTVTLPPVSGEWSYFSALAQIGAVALEHGPEADRASWEWALEKAIIEPGPAIRRRIARERC